MGCDADLAHRRLQRVAEARAGREGDGNMGDAARAEKAFLPRDRPVDELIGDDEMTGRHLLPERAAGGDGDDVGDARPLQRVDIGAIVDRGGRQAVAPAMARQKDEARAVQLAKEQLIRRLPPRRRDPPPFAARQSLDVIEARSPDHADYRLRHRLSPLFHALWRCVAELPGPGNAGLFKVSKGPAT